MSRDKDKGKKAAPRPMMDEESFSKAVCQAAAVADFGSDAEAFARALWPSVARLAESAFIEGRASGKKAPNPYSPT